ncbi:hypothetical protein MMC16_004064 [Acarospora aff. strigata]|nr:hypothetical protein [Acarospora aff. strigata]
MASSTRTIDPDPDPRSLPNKANSTASSQSMPSPSPSSPSPRSPMTPLDPSSFFPSSSSSAEPSYFTREPTSLDQRVRPRSPSGGKMSPLPSPTSSSSQSRPELTQGRSASDPSATATMQSQSQPTRPGHVKRKSRNSSGTVTQCGRHGNEWLFGNISVTGTVRGLFGPK